MKFAVIRLACFLSRQQTLCRVIAVASRIVHGALHSPPTCFGVESRWLDLGRMRPLTDGVCIKLLTRHPPPSQVAHYHPQVVPARRMAVFGTNETDDSSRQISAH
jgi:hypothetical protein